MPSPYLCRPFEHGADIVVHSATKYLGGHGTTMGGVIVESGKFPWDNGNFPEMTEPSRGYHGVRFYETFGDFGFTMKARMETMRTLGPRSRRSAPGCCCRASRRCRCAWSGTARTRSRWRSTCPRIRAVAWVNYPGLPDNRSTTRSRRSTCRRARAASSPFGVKGGAAAGVKFIEAARVPGHLANIGDAKTLVIHPASTTHRQLDEEEQRAAGVTPDMIRLSVGLETLDDILWDIDQALHAAAKV